MRRDETVEMVLTRILYAGVGLAIASVGGWLMWSVFVLEPVSVKTLGMSAAVALAAGRFLWVAWTGDSQLLNALRERSEEVRARSSAYHDGQPIDRRTHEEKVRAFRAALFNAELGGSEEEAAETTHVERKNG